MGYTCLLNHNRMPLKFKLMLTKAFSQPMPVLQAILSI